MTATHKRQGRGWGERTDGSQMQFDRVSPKAEFTVRLPLGGGQSAVS